MKNVYLLILCCLMAQAVAAQQMFSTRVSAINDDLEEYIPGTNQTKTVGSIDAASTDLELGNETTGSADPQMVGIRFANITIPKGAVITNAYIRFTVDATNKNTDPCNLRVFAQAADNPVTFDPAVAFNISSRPRLADSIAWAVPAGSWATVGESAANQTSSNLASLVQQLVNRTGWASGNAMAFFITGTGLREAESFDSGAATAPQLVIEYGSLATFTKRIAAADDDLEEYIAAPGQTKTLGSVDAGSSDLELGTETAGNVDPQLIGMRFTGITIPKNAVVKNAYIQFTVDETGKNTDPSNLNIYAQDADNPVIFSPSTPFTVSNRPRLTDSVKWSIPAGSWNVVEVAGPDQRTANIGGLVQKLVNRAGWASGNAMAFFVSGTGTRNAHAYDGKPDAAPQLIIEYVSNEVVIPVVPTNAITRYPIVTNSIWNYYDKGGAPVGDWKAQNFNDTTWTFKRGTFGYGISDVFTVVSSGTDPAKKHPTTYFRKRFEVRMQSEIADTVQLALRADDGAVVYLNGTEIARVNMPAGAVTDATLATKEVNYPDEILYFITDIAGSLLKVGQNVISVELHQNSLAGKDLAFDLRLNNRLSKAVANQGCRDANDLHIGCFTSLAGLPQRDTMTLPKQHGFQYLIATNDNYTSGGGKVSTNFDFTGYVPINGSSRLGYLGLNYETTPGGFSVSNLRFDNQVGLWKVDSIKAIDFSPVVSTIRNCSGTVTPWGTLITSEEGSNTLDANGDGYFDLGWNVEIEPKTKTIVKNQKLWALGRMNHENVVVAKDKKTVYQGEDAGNGAVYKFVADKEADLSSGKLYVLKLTDVSTDTAVKVFKNFTITGEPVGAVGTWVEVPNTTVAERNNVKAKGLELGATIFNGVEDVEISPVDGKIYFTVKSAPFNRVYRFKDDGTTLSAFETFIGGTSYRINTGTVEVDEDWGGGNDNLDFDDRGNLWVCQDGSRDHVWVVRPDHTQAKPKVDIFMLTPAGSEPTGSTFSPDYRYMFMSAQNPSATNKTPQFDISGKRDTFNRSHAIVIARTPYLGRLQTSTAEISKTIKATAYPNPSVSETNVVIDLKETATIQLSVFDVSGRLVTQTAKQQVFSGQFNHTFNLPTAGIYFIKVTANDASNVLRVVKL